MPRDVGQTNKQEDPAVYRCLPPKWAMHFNIDPSNVPDAALTDSELRAVVGNLRNGCMAGATGMKVEHLKEGLVDIKCKET
jgi:hypothetical protein